MPARQDADRSIRVMIVDDSIVARTLLARMLADQGDFVIAAQVGDAAAALDKLDDTMVDAILLDLAMPGLDGLSAIEALIERSRGARVLVVSSSAEDGAEASVTALRRGAADTLLKPAAGGLAGRFADELATRIRRIVRSEAGTTCVHSAPSRRAPTRNAPLACIAIGASTGGVAALGTFLAALPQDVAAPILVTQHLPASFMRYFADQLSDMGGRRARVAVDGMALVPGEILLAPGDAHLGLTQTRGLIHARLRRGPAPSGARPSVDPMFASVAGLFGCGAAGLVLSGMGRDGLIGARALAGVGGLILAQDAASSVVWGMPGAVVAAGVAEAALSPAEIAQWIGQWRAQAGETAWK